MNIILASKSPRRKEILSKFIKNFRVISLENKEEINKDFDIVSNSMSISRSKGLEIGKIYPDSLIISADTVVVSDDLIMGKPKSLDQARVFLKKLSGESHIVISSFYIHYEEKSIMVSDYQTSKVKFLNLDKKTIDLYLRSDEWIDKAGAYGVQEKGSVLIDFIYGDYNTIVGLPIAKINYYLSKYLNYNILEG